MALFGIAAFLLFLIQCLRLFDFVAIREQSLLTLLGQALLGMPGLGIVFLYVCIGIGLGRALAGLERRNELQIIHVSVLLPSLLRAVAGYAAGGTALLLLLAHVVDPLAVRTANNWSAGIAADLVSRSMVPHQFTEVADGVSIVIGSRDAQGQITDFFADDSRGELRRTYFARSALIVRDEQGYILRLQDGAMQQMTEGQRFSEVSFASYDLSLDRLTGSASAGSGLDGTPSYDLFGRDLSASETYLLLRRSAEGVRVLAICLLVAALAIFPSGKRRRAGIPIELTVLAAAFAERGITSYFPAQAPFNVATGSLLLGLVSLVILLIRLRLFMPVGLRRLAA